MPIKGNSGEYKARSPLSMVVAVGLCCFFYVLGAWQRSGYGKGDSIAMAVTRQTACTDASSAAAVAAGLSFETHLAGAANASGDGEAAAAAFAPCSAALADHTPCHDQERAMKFPRKNMVYRERHCPPDGERLRRLVPAPPGYVTPFPWPRSRDYVPFANAPYKSLTVEKAVQNWFSTRASSSASPAAAPSFPTALTSTSSHRPARLRRPICRRIGPHRSVRISLQLLRTVQLQVQKKLHRQD